jgi:hypothetical protein
VADDSIVSYTCLAEYTDGSTKDITSAANWSENSDYTTIDGNGNLTVDDVDSDQTVSITAEYEGKTDMMSVLIIDVPPAPDSIDITGPKLIEELTSESYTCTAYYVNGNSIDISSFSEWVLSSFDAVIDENGTITANDVANDTQITITASFKGQI